MTPGTIETRGSATHWVPAEHVDITFTVRRRAATSALAASGASRSFVDLEDALHAHAEVVVRRTTQSLTVRTAQQLNRKTGAWTDSGFEAQRSMTVRLGPVERAGAALRQVLAQVTDVTVSGPVFGVSPEHPSRADVRAEAAKVAHASAEHFASGPGLRLGAPQRLVEVDDGSVPLAFAAMGGAMADEAGSGVAALVDLTGEDVAVTATVQLVIATIDPSRPAPRVETSASRPAVRTGRIWR